MTPEKPQKKRWKFVYSIRRDGQMLQYRTVRADTVGEFVQRVNADIASIFGRRVDEEMQG